MNLTRSCQPIQRARQTALAKAASAGSEAAAAEEHAAAAVKMRILSCLSGVRTVEADLVIVFKAGSDVIAATAATAHAVEGLGNIVNLAVAKVKDAVFNIGVGQAINAVLPGALRRPADEGAALLPVAGRSPAHLLNGAATAPCAPDATAKAARWRQRLRR